MSDETNDQPKRTDQTRASKNAPARLRKKKADPGQVQPEGGVRSKADDKEERAKRPTRGEPSGGGGADWH